MERHTHIESWLRALPANAVGGDPGPWIAALERAGAPSDLLALAYGLGVRGHVAEVGRWRVAASAPGMAASTLDEWVTLTGDSHFDEVVGNCRIAGDGASGELVAVWTEGADTCTVVYFDLDLGTGEVVDSLDGWFAGLLGGEDSATGDSVVAPRLLPGGVRSGVAWPSEERVDPDAAAASEPRLPRRRARPLRRR